MERGWVVVGAGPGRERPQQLYVRGMRDQDMWDDTLLVKAYDKAMKGWKPADIAKRVAMSTNKDASESNKKWRVGQRCRALYEDDGQEYEAYILEILDKTDCLIRYIGYDDNAIVKMKDLKESRGDDAQATQIPNVTMEPSWDDIKTMYKINQDSLTCNNDSVATQDGHSESDAPGSQSGDVKLENMMECESIKSENRGAEINIESGNRRNKSKKKNKKSKCNKKRTSSNPLNDLFADLPHLPPMPHFDTDFTSQMPLLGGGLSLPMPPLPLNADSEDEDQELLASMLTSWYMSGYYAGLYQARMSKRSKKVS